MQKSLHGHASVGKYISRDGKIEQEEDNYKKGRKNMKIKGKLCLTNITSKRIFSVSKRQALTYLIIRILSANKMTIS